MNAPSSPLYDIDRTFTENFQSPLFSDLPIPSRTWPPRDQWKKFLGYPLASSLGVAACAVTTGSGIALLAQLGFDVLTYKTIRHRAVPAHPLPNIVYLEDFSASYSPNPTQEMIVRATNQIPPIAEMAISNSFGNNCFDPSVVCKDIAYAKEALRPGQVLIVSVYGDNPRSLKEDFVETAHLAKSAGADIIELNLSCPNLLGHGGTLYLDSDAVFEITQAVVKIADTLPVIVKIGIFPSSISLLPVLKAVAHAGGRGVCAINSVSMQVVANDGKPAFGERLLSGVSGAPIRLLALDFIRQAHEINSKNKLDLVLLGTGGVTLPQHFSHLLEAGADIAMCATAAMWNPYLALNYHARKQHASC